MPTPTEPTPTSEFLCPRRGEGLDVVRSPIQDRWETRQGHDFASCSYCGSMHPDTFLERVRAGIPVTPTDKSYKAYIGQEHKFYYPHLSAEQVQDFLAMYNDKTMKLEYPGRFYVLPFFARTR